MRDKSNNKTAVAAFRITPRQATEFGNENSQWVNDDLLATQTAE
jgi:hypothetical protein